MSYIRVTSSTLYQTMQQGLSRSITQVQRAQEALSTGKRVSAYSDAPVDAVSILRFQSNKSDFNDYDRGINDGLAWLSTTDTTLQSGGRVLARARDLALSGINGALGADSREALATDVEALRDQMFDLANTTYLGRPLFGGFGTAAVDLTAGVYSYNGDAGQVLRQIAPNVTVPVNTDGEAAFGFTAGANVFDTLTAIADALRTNNMPALTAGINTLDARVDDVRTALQSVGARVNQLEMVRDRGQRALLDLETNRSNLEDIDLPRAVIDMQQAQNSYTAALGAVSRAQLPTLAEFLR